ncbi:class II glutamine amidotransferase [Actinomadura parmotrematis]|uniref:Class II glutamine amidotransferase n=1 Tax=Actinomadura parmotrematis TaxID=2864039 RepID=A0ABS7FNF4_9ACTN|nr:class II glutamine amidotransferase [Actinomadura parmotrematis]MBW8481922.1 class II glutamine amidotransferase [Actinomadura parmotrematis]
MCRHFAWVGGPRTLNALFFEPSYGLPEQAKLPRWQQIGLVNKDGFGAGWHPAEGGTEVYRTTTPIWEDTVFPVWAPEVSARCVLGAARAASPGMPIEETANAPFTNGQVLFSLNGHCDVGKVGALLEAGRTPESTCDSAFLAAVLWQRLDQGAPLADAVEGLLYDVVALDPNACLNMLATDGARAVATTWAETLCYRREPDGVMVASEPQDDREDWTTVPDRSIVRTDGTSVEVEPLRTLPSASPTVLPGEAVPG